VYAGGAARHHGGASRSPRDRRAQAPPRDAARAHGTGARRAMNRLTIGLAILAAGLVLLIVNHDSGETFGLANDDFGRLVSLAGITALIGAGVVASRRQMGESLRQAGIWLLILLALTAGYLYRYDLQSFVNRLTAGLIPGRAVVTTAADGSEILVVHRQDGGHFATDVSIDGVT